MEYNGAQIVVNCFLELNWPKESRILDIGAGTGIIGSLLKQEGYENVDGLDASNKMLEIAKQKKCYKNLINCIVASDIRLPIESRTYDVVIMAGVFCPGHISVDAFNEILRITKSGETAADLALHSCCAREAYTSSATSSVQCLSNAFL